VLWDAQVIGHGESLSASLCQTPPGAGQKKTRVGWGPDTRQNLATRSETVKAVDSPSPRTAVKGAAFTYQFVLAPCELLSARHVF